MTGRVIYNPLAGGGFAAGVQPVGLGLGSVAVAAGPGLVCGIAVTNGGVVSRLRTVVGTGPDRDTAVMAGTVHVVRGVVPGTGTRA